MLNNSPCDQAHTYAIEFSDGLAPRFADAETARSVFIVTGDEWQPRWRAQHFDGTQCLLEAAFQTALSVREVFIQGGEDPTNPDLRKGQLIGVFVVLCANMLTMERGEGDLRVYVAAIGNYVLHELPREEPALFQDLMGWLEKIETVGGAFPSVAPPLHSETIEGLARELVRKLLNPSL